MPPAPRGATISYGPRRAPLVKGVVRCLWLEPTRSWIRADYTKVGRPSRVNLRRTDQRDGFPFVPAIHAKILAVERDDGVTRVQLAHPDQAEIRQVGFSVRESF